MPRHTLDRWVYKIKTMDVCLTKHKEEDIYNHMVTMYKKAEEIFNKYEAKYRAILKEFDDDENHMYARYNWKQGDPSRFWKKQADMWFLADVAEDNRESVSAEYFSIFQIYSDFMMCDKYAEEWNEQKPDWNSMIYEITQFHSILKDVGETIKLYEEMDFNKYKALWIAKNKDWIDEQERFKEHTKTHPKIELPSTTNLDKDPDPYPENPLRDDCSYCKQHWEEMKPKYDKAIEIWKRNKQDELDWLQQKELETSKNRLEREQKAKAYQQWLKKQDPINLHCDHCNFTAEDDLDLDEHNETEEHKEKARFCKYCNIQCPSDYAYRNHIETVKHKKNVGLINATPKVYKCNKCDYETITKANYERHCFSKHKNDE